MAHTSHTPRIKAEQAKIDTLENELADLHRQATELKAALERLDEQEMKLKAQTTFLKHRLIIHARRKQGRSLRSVKHGNRFEP